MGGGWGGTEVVAGWQGDLLISKLIFIFIFYAIFDSQLINFLLERALAAVLYLETIIIN